MSTTCLEPSPASAASTDDRPGDTLAASLVLMVAMLGVQRVVGFVREVLFCRWLDPAALGEWELAFSLLTMAAPLVVLGVPGTFGRYVEHFRRRAQLVPFVRRTALVVGILATLAVSIAALEPQWFSRWAFGRPDHFRLVGLAAAGLAAVIFFNFTNDLFASLRRFRVVSALQFAQAVAFAALGIALAALWQASAEAVVVAYTASCALAALAGAWLLRSSTTAEGPPQPLLAWDLWHKLAPFALWVWVTNGLFNLFFNVDRYVLVHQSGLSAEAALELVGNYRASRVVPLLISSIAATLASVLLPHLSHDWEAGRRADVARRMGLVLKVLGLAGLAASVVVLVAAPLLFDVAFEGKYPQGAAILPWTLTYCLWIGLGLIAFNYLWCAERAGLGSLAVLLGLAANLGLNLWLAPRYGLAGVAVGTAAANLLVLLAVYFFAWRHGFRPDAGTWAVTLLPLALLTGPWAALTAVLLALYAAVRTTWLFSAADQGELRDAFLHYARKIWPALGR